MAGDSPERRISLAWRELRRGAANGTLRGHLIGDDAPDIELAQLDALEVLGARHDGWRMSELADALHVDPSAATRAIERLERSGLAERRPGEPDRRVVVATVTDRGRRLLDRVARRRAHGMRRILETFTDAERRRFADDLDRFVAAVDELVRDLERG